MMSRGAKYLLYSVSCFAVVNICVKSLSHIHFTEIVFFRALFSFIACYWGIRKLGISLWGNNKFFLIGRGIAGTIALTLFFYALQRMPLATAVTLQYLSPIFTVIWAHLIFKEKATALQWFFFVFGFVGVWLIQGFDPRVDGIDTLIAISSAVASGLAYTFVRRLKGVDHELVVIFYFPLITLPVLFPFLIKYWVTPSLIDTVILFIIGVFTQAAQIFLTRGYQAQKAADIGVVNYLGVIYAAAFGWILFSESIPLMALLGIALILICISMSQLLGHFRRERPPIL